MKENPRKEQNDVSMSPSVKRGKTFSIQPNSNRYKAVTYPEPCQTSKMERFLKTVGALKEIGSRKLV